MTNDIAPDELLLVVVLTLAFAASVVYWLVDVWRESDSSAVVAEIWAGWLQVRVRRKAIRNARLSGNRAEVLTRFRVVLGGKR